MREEDLLRLTEHYLLGSLSPADREQFEDRLFDDPSMADRIEDAERDLLDDYARNQLSGTERIAVERRLLGVPGRDDRLETAFAMQGRRQRHFPVWMSAVAATVILGCALWYFRPVASTIAQVPVARKTATLAAGPPASADVHLPVIAVFALQPGTLRSGDSPVLQIGKNVTDLRLNLELSTTPAVNLDARLVTHGRAVWKQSGLQSYSVGLARAVTLSIPAGELASGDYEITLGEPNTREFYYFRLVRKK